jgi:hypothetical protein
VRAENLEPALECYADTRQVWTREAVPNDWARVRMNMGILWVNRAVGDRADNFEQALGFCADALQVWTSEAVAHKWVIFQMNMGDALYCEKCSACVEHFVEGEQQLHRCELHRVADSRRGRPRRQPGASPRVNTELEF